jgi:hypothetical protein
VAKVTSKDRRFLCVFVPRDIWNDLEFLVYVLRLEGNPKTKRKTKGEIVAEALKEYFHSHPELEKEIERAKKVYHVEIEGGGQA